MTWFMKLNFSRGLLAFFTLSKTILIIQSRDSMCSRTRNDRRYREDKFRQLTESVFFLDEPRKT